MKSTIEITTKDYTSKGRALAAAKRIYESTHGYMPGELCYGWTMDNVRVRKNSYGGWNWYLVFEADQDEDAMAEVEAQERLDMEDEAYFERISDSKEEAQEAPCAEAEQESEVNKVKEMTSMELSLAVSTGKGTLAETISRMETALKHLKEFQREYNSGNPKEDAFYMAERLRRASNEIHGYLCTSLAMELATTAGALEQLAKATCRLDMDGE